jgi:hypothetical protein
MGEFDNHVQRVPFTIQCGGRQGAALHFLLILPRTLPVPPVRGSRNSRSMIFSKFMLRYA